MRFYVALPLILFGCKATPLIDPIEHQNQVIANIKVEKIADTLPGAKLYIENGCIDCHGDMLQGGKKGPPLIHPIYKQGSHSDARFYLSIKEGAEEEHWYFGDMPPNPDLTDVEIQQLSDFIKASIKMNNVKSY